MATGKRPPSGSLRRRRRRPAPTIDLKATEVASEPVAPPPPRLEPLRLRRPARRRTPPPVPPSEAPHAARAATRRRPGIAWLPPDVPWPVVAAGAAGAAAVLLFVLLIWLISPRSGDAVATLTPRLAAIETQLRDLAARPAPAGVDPQAIEALSARLAKLESAVARATAAGGRSRAGGPRRRGGRRRQAAVRFRRRADPARRRGRRRVPQHARPRRCRAAALAELQNAARVSSADHGEIAKLAGRIAALEKADRAVADQLAKSAADAGSDRPVRLAVAAAALRAAVERGEPFAAELAAVKPLAGDAAALAAIEPFAASGVPAPPALGRELLVLLPAMQRAAGAAPRDGGFLDRLQANAERLVRIRPVEESAGEDATAMLSRIEVQGRARATSPARSPSLPSCRRRCARRRPPGSPRPRRAARPSKPSRRLAADAIAALKTTP